MSQHNLAYLYSELNRFAESEALNKATLEIYQQLAKDNPESYDPYVAKSLNNLASINITISQYEEAENMFKSA